MSARSLLILAGLSATSALAAPTIDPQFGDHAVIQRSKPIQLSGAAAPSERLVVAFGGTQKSAKADASGRWQVDFPARAAGENLSIKVTGTSGFASAEDIAIGDVWLCSGQSNMEYPLRRALNSDSEVANAGDAGLRVLKVPQQLAQSPQRAFAKAPSWQRTSPESVKDFSAACYFMARELRASEKVPLGAIDDTWGGTPIRQWMNEAAARAGGEAALVDVVELYRSNPTLASQRFGQQWEDWWRSHTGDASGKEPWNASDRLSWKAVPSISHWDDWGDFWKKFDGGVWFRRHVTVTAAQALQDATLSLGVVDDLDETFVNGVAVGGTNDWSAERNYSLPKGLLHSGDNEILVYVQDNWGPGGLTGPADKMKLNFASGGTVPFADGWQYSIIDHAVGNAPTAPWQGVSGVSQIYNAMVAPLGPLGMKGVAWYQGEADVGNAGYDRRLAAWTVNWRTQFRDPKLPFLIVGLAGFGKPTPGPVESGWAALINEQRLAVQRDPRAALISAIDLGEPNDIHPANKQDVGKRLALAARTLAYSGGTVGPLPVSAARAGNGVVVKFTKPLQVLNSGRPATFELCGAAANTCRYADARVTGDTVEILGDGQPVSRVRYAWADYPVVNLYDQDLLPAPVFELPIQ
jgi:sialate O-acetylesterase